MDKILYRVMVRGVADAGSLPIEPFGRPKEQAEGIARQMAAIAKRRGWNLSYFIEVCDGEA